MLMLIANAYKFMFAAIIFCACALSLQSVESYGIPEGTRQSLFVNRYLFVNRQIEKGYMSMHIDYCLGGTTIWSTISSAKKPIKPTCLPGPSPAMGCHWHG